MADAQASGACGRKIVWVQVPSPALLLHKKLETSETNVSGVFLCHFLDKVHKKEKNVIEKM